jgi:hypothetical protein
VELYRDPCKPFEYPRVRKPRKRSSRVHRVSSKYLQRIHPVYGISFSRSQTHVTESNPRPNTIENASPAVTRQKIQSVLFRKRSGLAEWFTAHSRSAWSAKTKYQSCSALDGADSLTCCVNRSPNRLLRVTLCLEYLSSGEKRAGCADLVARPFTNFWSV